MRKFAVLLALGILPSFARADLGINVYGLSYHFDQDKAKELGVDHRVNPGLGVRWRERRTDWDWFADVGFYRDSGRNRAKLAGLGALWHAGEGLRLGGALAYLRSETYNDGKGFIAPLPVIAYDWRAATLNMVVLPKVHQLNNINTLAFWLTFWLP